MKNTKISSESKKEKIVKMLQEIANINSSKTKENQQQEILNQKSKYYTKDNMSVIKVKEYVTLPWTMNYHWFDLLFDRFCNRFFSLLLSYKMMVFGKIDGLGKEEEKNGLADTHVFIDDKNRLHIDIVSNFDMTDWDIKVMKECLDEAIKEELNQ